MSNGTCSLDGCDRPIKARGYCNPHYNQQRLGKPFKAPSVQDQLIEVRFWAKVHKTETCWEWVGGKQPRGYGTFGVEGKIKLAHRVAWEWLRGPIPEGMVIDHICHNRSCVNPDHLRVATIKQNGEYRRGPNRNNRSSGVRGVHRNGNSWSAIVGHNGVHIRLGGYSSVAEAEAVVVEARARLFDF